MKSATNQIQLGLVEEDLPEAPPSPGSDENCTHLVTITFTRFYCNKPFFGKFPSFDKLK